MPIGTTVRRLLGPLETKAIDLYRGYFIDLEELVRDIASFGDFDRVLEIGAGDGLVCALMRDAMPKAEILGIDIDGATGRMVSDHERIEFRQVSTGELLTEAHPPFDLVIIVDVLHHVPVADRPALIRDAVDLLAPGGLLVVKDWERDDGLHHRVTYFADRYISGDRTVAFMTRDELLDVVYGNAGSLSKVAEFRVPPRANNLFLALRRG